MFVKDIQKEGEINSRSHKRVDLSKGPKTCFPSRAPTDAMLLAECLETYCTGPRLDLPI
jgi:hypothetical protein